jgi:hypothetical protein
MLVVAVATVLVVVQVEEQAVAALVEELLEQLTLVVEAVEIEAFQVLVVLVLLSFRFPSLITQASHRVHQQ